MVAAFDYCLHGKGGAAPSIDTAMHGLVDARARRPPAPGLRDRAGHRGRRGGADRGDASATGWSGCRGAGPASSSAWTSRRSRRANPQAIGVHPGRARHHRLGRDQRRVRGELAGDHPHRAGSSSTERGAAEPFGAGGARATSRCRRPSGTPRRRRCFPMIRGLASTDRPAGRPLHRHRRRAGLPVPGEARPAGRAGHLLPGPLPAHQGQAAGARPARRRRPLDEIVARLRELHAAYRDDYQAYYERHATADSPADARRRPGDRAGARRGHVLASARTSRPRGSPASSTSTRST